MTQELFPEMVEIVDEKKREIKEPVAEKKCLIFTWYAHNGIWKQYKESYYDDVLTRGKAVKIAEDIIKNVRGHDK